MRAGTCARVAGAPLLDGDTIRQRHGLLAGDKVASGASTLENFPKFHPLRNNASGLIFFTTARVLAGHPADFG